MESNKIDCNQKNFHERDELCLFDPKHHKYEIGGAAFRSVTTIISQFFPVFDPEEAIRKMKNGRNWNPNHRYWGMQDYQIKQAWEEKGILAAEKGTFLHEQIENFFLGREYEKPLEFELFRQFQNDHKLIPQFYICSI